MQLFIFADSKNGQQYVQQSNLGGEGYYTGCIFSGCYGYCKNEFADDQVNNNVLYHPKVCENSDMFALEENYEGKFKGSCTKIHTLRFLKLQVLVY